MRKEYSNRVEAQLVNPPITMEEFEAMKEVENNAETDAEEMVG